MLNINENVIEIPARIGEKKALLKVAACCRVSTESDEQHLSFESQIKYYTQRIKENPEWEFAGIYAEKVSGTDFGKRDEFNRMIKDAKAGKIDLILIKSISRFGRNTLAFLGSLDEEGNLVIVEEEAKIVRLIFDLYLQGNGCRKIKKYLEQHGIKTVAGMDTWSTATIDRMLSNEKYAERLDKLARFYAGNLPELLGMMVVLYVTFVLVIWHERKYSALCFDMGWKYNNRWIKIKVIIMRKGFIKSEEGAMAA